MARNPLIEFLRFMIVLMLAAIIVFALVVAFIAWRAERSLIRPHEYRTLDRLLRS